MKRIVFLWMIFLMLLPIAAEASLTYGPTNYQRNLRHLGKGYGNNDPVYLFINEVDELVGATAGTATASSAVVLDSSSMIDTLIFSTSWAILEGGSSPTKTTTFIGGDQTDNITYTLPVDDGTAGQLLSTDGSGVLSWTSGGAGSVTDLDTAYNGGYAIDVDGSAVTLTVSDTDNNPALAIVQNDVTNDPSAMTITSTADSATAKSLQFTSTAGYDIYGTSGNWYISRGGVFTCDSINSTNSIITGDILEIGSSLVLESGDKIDNTSATEISLIDDGGEDLIFDMDAASNAVGLKSSTGVDELAFGAVDDLTGVGTIVMDAAAASITTATDGDAQDLTIGITGATNSSLIVSSSGTAADAMQHITTAGGQDYTISGAAANEDFDFVTNTSFNVTTTEAAANQFYIQTQGTIAGNAVNIVTTDGGVSIAASGAANGDVSITAADDMTITATDDLAINGGSTGSLVTLGTSAYAQLITIGNETGASSLALKAGTGNITMDGVAATTITVGDAAQTGTMKFGESSASVEVDLGTGNGNKTMNIGVGTGVNAINIGTGGTGAKTIAVGDGASTGTTTIVSGSGGVLINNSINSNTSINTGTSTGTVSVGSANAGVITVDTGAGFSIDGGTASNVTAATEDLTVAATAGSVVISAGEAVDDAIQLTGQGVTVSGKLVRTGQQYVQTVGYCKVGTTAGWAVPAAADAAHLATLPQSQTASTLIIPITIPLKIGWTITAWTLNGQIDSAGNTATLDASLYKHTEAEAGFSNAQVGSGMAQLSKTADYKVVDGESGLSEVVAADESYYLLITGTTAATTDIEIAGITVTVSEI